MFSDACGVHVCMWCMYMVHLYAPVIGDAYGHMCACMYLWCIYAPHVFGGACMCMWCMYVYMVHLCIHICLVVHECIYGAYMCL